MEDTAVISNAGFSPVHFLKPIKSKDHDSEEITTDDILKAKSGLRNGMRLVKLDIREKRMWLFDAG